MVTGSGKSGANAVDVTDLAIPEMLRPVPVRPIAASCETRRVRPRPRGEPGEGEPGEEAGLVRDGLDWLGDRIPSGLLELSSTGAMRAGLEPFVKETVCCRS